MTALLRQWLVNDSGMPADWMSGIKANLSKQNIRVIPAGIGVGEMKADYADTLHILLAVCCLVLLIACANIANLLLARGAARRTQTSIRLALGASRKRLIRQTLTESILLSVFGGIAGLAVAYLGVKAIVALAFHGAHFVPIAATPSLPVLAFAFALSLVTGAIFGTAPAWLATRANPVEALRGANRSTRDHASWSQKTLVIVQATLSVVLLTGAGLLTRSLTNLQHQDFGYDIDHRVVLGLIAPWPSYSMPQLDAMYRELQDRLSHIPGVERAALAQYTPLTDNWGEMVIRQGHGMPSMNDPVGSSWDHVAPGYLETLGQHIIRGRSISEDDTASTQNVVVVDEAFVKRFFKPGENPIGQYFGLDLPRYSSTYRNRRRRAQRKVQRPRRHRAAASHVLRPPRAAREIRRRLHDGAHRRHDPLHRRRRPPDPRQHGRPRAADPHASSPTSTPTSPCSTSSPCASRSTPTSISSAPSPT